jgi:uncharacterized protein YunC (DUF1805 family)
MNEPSARIITCPSSATAPPESAGNVIVSGSYGGEYNAYHAAKLGIRGVVLNDAGVGKNNAGTRGLAYLDRVGLPAATADAQTCCIGDGDDMLARGMISYVNQAARRMGCEVGQSVRECAQILCSGPVVVAELPPIKGGKRYEISAEPGKPKVICLDAAPMLQEADKNAIAITGSHAALFRGRPDNVIGPQLHAVFFSDAGVGKDEAGIRRLSLLDERRMAAGTASAATGAIGDSRDIYNEGVLSHVNQTASQRGVHAGMSVKAAVEQLLLSCELPDGHSQGPAS